MGGGKGQKTTTSTTVNPVQQMQAPYLQDAWQQAQNLYQGQQAAGPGSTIASAGSPWMDEGYKALYNNALNLDQTLRPQASNFWTTGGGGDIYNSPAYNYYQNMAQGATPPQQTLANVSRQSPEAGLHFANLVAGNAGPAAAYGNAAAAGNLGLSQLGRTASGEYINGNPWFAQMVSNTMDPITRQYQTAVAPQLDATFMNSGRYGSGAMLGQRENAQNTLADQLAKTSSNMYGQNYANERQQQLNAASQYGQLYNQGQQLGMQGAQTAANIQNAAGQNYFTGAGQGANTAAQQLAAMGTGAAGLQGGYQSGNAAALQAAQMYPQLADSQYNAARNVILGGQGLNTMQQQYIDEPYNMLDRYLKQIGAVQGGSSSTTTPYFTNPFANAMSGITGGLDIMQKLGGMGGLGGSSGYPSSITGSNGNTWVNGTGMGSGIYTNMANGYTSDQAGSGFPGIPQVASGIGGLGSIASGIGSIFSGGWIICTELMRQGRMPWRYWAIGTRAFEQYPEVVRRGYYIWAIPVVRHLRRKPDSMLSRVTGAVFRWRAEDLAARRGQKGARKLLRGRMVTWVLYPVCAAIGAVVPAQDWQQVYRDASA